MSELRHRPFDFDLAGYLPRLAALPVMARVAMAVRATRRVAEHFRQESVFGHAVELAAAVATTAQANPIGAEIAAVARQAIRPYTLVQGLLSQSARWAAVHCGRLASVPHDQAAAAEAVRSATVALIYNEWIRQTGYALPVPAGHMAQTEFITCFHGGYNPHGTERYCRLPVAILIADLDAAERLADAEGWSDVTPVLPEKLGSLWPDALAAIVPPVPEATDWLKKLIGDDTGQPTVSWGFVSGSNDNPAGIRAIIRSEAWGEGADRVFTWAEIRNDSLFRTKLADLWDTVLDQKQGAILAAAGGVTDE